ncbi:MAG: precorrin-3B C(17)-methyltransferase, partial [Candidatus Omnitrophica bacterium]|nr:precorrin-3B C(17)-methyltransferase [Candidatus Omnitrophota bacterium]
MAETNNRQCNSSSSHGKLSIIGIGPGRTGLLAQDARQAIEESQVIIGYKTYVRLLGDLRKGKQVIAYGMGQEIERAKCALQKASEGEKVCLVSSGDPGIYGTSGLVLELLNPVQTADSKEQTSRLNSLRQKQDRFKIEIIPGISAASACASLLGAPLMHDFAVISLSDLLTERELIKKRIELAAQGDFVIVFYNPKSKKRTAPFEAAWQILMKYRSPQTPAGMVKNAYRGRQHVQITRLKDMPGSDIDMFTT